MPPIFEYLRFENRQPRFLWGNFKRRFWGDYVRRLQTVRTGTFRRNFFDLGSSGWGVAIVGALGTAAFIPAFKLTSIANVSLIYAIAPLIAASLAWGVIGERIS
ncbi:MAG: hypothetical protein AAGL98_02345, partial [Planctomycetota bacterium]